MVANYAVPATHSGFTMTLDFLVSMASSPKPFLPDPGTCWTIRALLSICSHAIITEFHFLIFIHASIARPKTPCIDCVIRFPWTPFTLGYLLFLGYFASLRYRIWGLRDLALILPERDNTNVDGSIKAASQGYL